MRKNRYTNHSANPFFPESNFQTANVPCVPGSDGLVLTEKDALDVADKIGFPLMIKATAGKSQDACNMDNRTMTIRGCGFLSAGSEASPTPSSSPGGGGRGMRMCTKAEDLLPLLRAAQGEAEAAFGNGACYIERYVQNPRHIEFQVLADKHGNAIHLGERDCSIQRRNQKLLEEGPSPALTPEVWKGGTGT